MIQYAIRKADKLRRRLLAAAGRRREKRVVFDYQPEPGQQSEKAERLVAFCLGDFQQKPILPRTGQRRYLKENDVLLIESNSQGVTLSAHANREIGDTKKIVKAWISQRAEIPPHLRAWLIRDDSAGRRSDPAQGVHLSGMRSADRRDLVLVPTGNRERYLGPNLARQLDELRTLWVPWEQKSNSVWWGGALTGQMRTRRKPRTLTRGEVLHHFAKHPSDQVSLHLTEVQNKSALPPGVELEAKFTKQSAFAHKCLVLLPGNDIASGSSWYFAGNSVVLMPKPHLEHILYFEMEPWKHYVPLENDPADILTKLRWVRENEQQAQQIVANSHDRLRWLCGPEYLWACNEVLRQISRPRS